MLSTTKLNSLIIDRLRPFFRGFCHFWDSEDVLSENCGDKIQFAKWLWCFESRTYAWEPAMLPKTVPGRTHSVHRTHRTYEKEVWPK